MLPKSLAAVEIILTKEIERITTGTRGGLGGRDRTLAVKSRKSAFFVKNGFLKKLRWAHQTSVDETSNS